jgi:hypothetical protein
MCRGASAQQRLVALASLGLGSRRPLLGLLGIRDGKHEAHLNEGRD